MRPTSFMRDSVTFLVRSTAIVEGEPIDTFATGDTVPAYIRPGSGSGLKAALGRVETRMAVLADIGPHDDAVPGNRLTLRQATYEIRDVDDARPDVWTLTLEAVVRGAVS